MLNLNTPSESKSLADFDEKINPYPRLIRNSKSSITPAPVWGKALQAQKGKWQTKFKQEKPLYLEIGCHKGITICDMAQDHKNCNFMGFDITFKRVYKTFERAVQKKLDNVLSCLADAKHLEQFLADEELTGALAFFPDPWIKKKSQKKNRLFSPMFCSTLEKKIRTGGFFWLKTDSLEYYQDICEFMNACSFRTGSLSDTTLKHNYSSSYEKKFLESQTPFYSQVWIKK